VRFKSRLPYRSLRFITRGEAPYCSALLRSKLSGSEPVSERSREDNARAFAGGNSRIVFRINRPETRRGTAKRTFRSRPLADASDTCVITATKRTYVRACVRACVRQTHRRLPSAQGAFRACNFESTIGTLARTSRKSNYTAVMARQRLRRSFVPMLSRSAAVTFTLRQGEPFSNPTAEARTESAILVGDEITNSVNEEEGCPLSLLLVKSSRAPRGRRGRRGRGEEEEESA